MVRWETSIFNLTTALRARTDEIQSVNGSTRLMNPSMKATKEARQPPMKDVV